MNEYREMKKMRVLIAIGVILSTFGFFLGIRGAVIINYPLIILNGFIFVLGLGIISYAWNKI